MNLRSVFFILLMFLLYLSFHVFFFFHFSHFFSWSFFLTLFIGLGSALLFPLITLLEHMISFPLLRGLYFIITSFEAFLLLADFLLLIHDLFFLLFSLFAHTYPFRYVLFFILSISLFAIIYGFFHNQTLKVKEATIPLEHLNESLTVVHLSDLHVGSWQNKQWLMEIVEKTNSYNPDFVFITGDLVDGTDHLTPEDLLPLHQLKASYGVYFTLGNHERYFGIEKTLALLPKTVTVLRNKAQDVGPVGIIGIDYPEDETQRNNPTLLELAHQLPEKKPKLVLYHTPLGIKEFLNSSATIQFSGHTHGGQVFPFTLAVHAYYPYARGLHYIKEQKWLLVSQGAGTWGPPIRLGTENELWLVHLIPQKETKNHATKHS